MSMALAGNFSRVLRLVLYDNLAYTTRLPFLFRLVSRTSNSLDFRGLGISTELHRLYGEVPLITAIRMLFPAGTRG